MSNDVEDAKVREFIQVTDNHELNVDYRITDWDRDQYRRVRDLFTRDETPGPRVLNYGDLEPDRGTKWRTALGHTVAHEPRGWRFLTSHEVSPWEHFGALLFPMMEVTD